MNPKHLSAPPSHKAILSGLCLSLTLWGCASTAEQGAGTPVLYPNTAYQNMGEAAAKQHVSRCLNLAQTSGLTPTSQKSTVGAGAAVGAAIAGVSGAVGGLVFGRGDVGQALKHGAQTAVVGAAAGGTRAAMSQQASSTYRQFVQRCVGEKGLDIIGWQ